MTTCERLFVYGTLMSEATGRLGTRQRARLKREGRSLGRARVTGRLYDLGDYPGLVIGPGHSGTVHGEVFELSTPEATLSWLDAYEGVRKGGLASDEYFRTLILSRLQSGEILEAWVYIYQSEIEGKKVVVGGSWLGWRMKNLGK